MHEDWTFAQSNVFVQRLLKYVEWWWTWAEEYELRRDCNWKRDSHKCFWFYSGECRLMPGACGEGGGGTITDKIGRPLQPSTAGCLVLWSCWSLLRYPFRFWPVATCTDLECCMFINMGSMCYMWHCMHLVGIQFHISKTFEFSCLKSCSFKLNQSACIHLHLSDFPMKLGRGIVIHQTT